MLPVSPFLNKPAKTQQDKPPRSLQMEELGKNRRVSSSLEASQMEVLLSKSHVMLRKNGQSLLYSRENGSLLPGNG